MELLILRLHCLFDLVYQEGKGKYSLPGIILVGGAIAATSLTGGLGAIPAAGLTLGGMQASKTLQQFELPRSAVANLNFIRLSKFIEYCFEPRSSGWLGRLLGYASETIGLIRLKLPSQKECYFLFDMSSPVPLNPQSLWDLREKVLMVYDSGLITLDDIQTLTLSLKSPLPNSAYPNKGLINESTAFYLESLHPLCLDTEIMRKRDDMAKTVEDPEEPEKRLQNLLKLLPPGVRL